MPDEAVLKELDIGLVVGVELGTGPDQAEVIHFVVVPVSWRSSVKMPGENSRPPKISTGAAKERADIASKECVVIGDLEDRGQVVLFAMFERAFRTGRTLWGACLILSQMHACAHVCMNVCTNVLI